MRNAIGCTITATPSHDCMRGVRCRTVSWLSGTRLVGVVLPLLALLAVVGPASLRAQDTTGGVKLATSVFTTEGREFWVVFQKNFRDYMVDSKTQAQVPAQKLELELYIASSKNTRVRIEIPGIDFRTEQTVRAGRVATVRIDTAAQLRSSEQIEQLGVHIISDEPVSVYGLNRRFQTTDTYLAHPVNVLGKVYRAMGYRWLQNDLLSQVAIVATQPNTRVRITPSAQTNRGRPADVPFEVVLGRGDAYQVIPRYNPATTSDLTGTVIEADKPIAVFSGHNCAYVPDMQTKACNLLVEQLPAVPSWGRQFFVGTLAGRTSSVLRVLASVDNTQVFENGRLVATLPAGQFYENTDQTSHTLITATQPVLVAQYSKGYDNGDNLGDPMMIVVSPTEQFLNSYRFATPVRGSWNHYINLIAPTTTITQLRLDGRPIEATKFRPFGLSRYSIGQIQVPYGTHVIEGPEPFGLYSYGFGYDEAAYDAYGNGGGQAMDVVIELPDTTAPSFDARMDATSAVITAVAREDRVHDRGMQDVTVLDQDNFNVGDIEFALGAPLVPVQLRQRQPGMNSYALFRLTDRAGNVSYFTVCARYDELGDSLRVTILPDGASCDFAPKITYNGLLAYSVISNHVVIPPGSEDLKNPVELVGALGAPAWSVGVSAEMLWRPHVVLVGRASLGVLPTDAFGYTDSLGTFASDGRRVVEEYHLDRVAIHLSIGGGAQWYLVDRRAYVFGILNLAVPIVTSETFSRTILSPSDYVHAPEDGSAEDPGERVLYDGSGPAGIALAVIPEFGVGTTLELPGGWRVFGELGWSGSITSISPDRDWTITSVFGRLGARVRL